MSTLSMKRKSAHCEPCKRCLVDCPQVHVAAGRQRPLVYLYNSRRSKGFSDHAGKSLEDHKDFLATYKKTFNDTNEMVRYKERKLSQKAAELFQLGTRKNVTMYTLRDLRNVRRPWS